MSLSSRCEGYIRGPSTSRSIATPGRYKLLAGSHVIDDAYPHDRKEHDMALTTCPDCGKQISSSAANCPGCGRPMAAFSGKAVQTRRKGGLYEGIGFLLMLVGGLALLVSQGLGVGLIAVGFVVFLVGRFM